MTSPTAVVRQVNVLVTQSALADTRRELSAMAFRLVIRVGIQDSVVTNFTLDVIALPRAFT